MTIPGDIAEKIFSASQCYAANSPFFIEGATLGYTLAKRESSIKFVYVILGCHRSPVYREDAGEWMNTAFLTEKEAIDFCSFHDDGVMFLRWKKVLIGKFNIPNKKKCRRSK